MTVAWKDITSYAKGEPEPRTPQTFTCEHGAVMVIVTRWLHGSVRGKGWFMLCYALGYEEHVDLATEDLEEAKRRALRAVKDRALDLVVAVDTMMGMQGPRDARVSVYFV